MIRKGNLYTCNKCKNSVFMPDSFTKEELDAGKGLLENNGIHKISSTIHFCDTCFEKYQQFIGEG